MEVIDSKNYRVGDKLGSGAFAKVYQGRDSITGNEVALKVLCKNQELDEVKQQKVVNIEVEAMAKIDHENVLKVYGVDWNAKLQGVEMDEPCSLIVTEIAKGGLLFDLLAKRRHIPEDIVRTHFAQIVAGLSACHKAGVAHRDLSKPFLCHLLNVQNLKTSYWTKTIASKSLILGLRVLTINWIRNILWRLNVEH